MKAENNNLMTQIKQIVDQISRNYNPEKILVFGSAAQGRFGKDSDIDLMIVKSTKKDYFKRTYEVRCCLDTDLPLDILVYTPEELEQRRLLGDSFIQQVLAKGKVLYEK